MQAIERLNDKQRCNDIRIPLWAKSNCFRYILPVSLWQHCLLLVLHNCTISSLVVWLRPCLLPSCSPDELFGRGGCSFWLVIKALLAYKIVIFFNQLPLLYHGFLPRQNSLSHCPESAQILLFLCGEMVVYSFLLSSCLLLCRLCLKCPKWR